MAQKFLNLPALPSYVREEGDGAGSRRRQRRDGTVDDGDGERRAATRVEYETGAGGEGAQSAVRSVDVCVGV